jgi:hypothetical protein
MKKEEMRGGGGDVRLPGAADVEMRVTLKTPQPKRLAQPNERYLGPEWTR